MRVGWKLNVTQSNFSNRDYVSKFFHYYGESSYSLCRKWSTEDFFETDIDKMGWSVKEAYEKGLLCKKCMKKLLEEKSLSEILGEAE